MFYYKVKIEGLNLDRFITNCVKNGIILKNVRKKDRKTLIVSLNYTNLKKLFAKVDTKCYNITLLKKGLIPLFRENIIKRCGIFAGLTLGIIAVLFLSQIYWRVDINCDNTLIIQNMSNQLIDAGISPGVKISNVNLDELEVLLLNNNPELASVSLHREGVVLKVDVYEALPKDEKQYNLYSSANAIITKIVVINGQQMVNEGDIVKKGDLLVQASSDGKKAVAVIFGKVYITADEEFNKYTYNVENTGEEIEFINLEFAGFTFGKKKEITFKEYEQVVTEGYITKFLLPVKYKKTLIKESEINIVENVFSDYEDIIKQNAYDKAFSLYDSGKIIDTWYNIKERGDIITVTAVLEIEKIISED